MPRVLRASPSSALFPHSSAISIVRSMSSSASRVRPPDREEPGDLPEHERLLAGARGQRLRNGCGALEMRGRAFTVTALPDGLAEQDLGLGGDGRVDVAQCLGRTLELVLATPVDEEKRLADPEQQMWILARRSRRATPRAGSAPAPSRARRARPPGRRRRSSAAMVLGRSAESSTPAARLYSTAAT